MNLELVLIVLLFIFSTVLLLKDLKYALYVLMFLSLLLHKELFSIYIWDMLPSRIFMLALTFVTALQVFIYFRKPRLRFEIIDAIHKILYDPFSVLLLLLWLIQLLSIVFSKNLVSSLNHIAFSTTIMCLWFLMKNILLNDKAQIIKYVRTYSLLAFLTCLFGVLQLILLLKFDFTIGALWSIPGHTPRIGSSFWDVNHYGAFLAALMPVLGVMILLDTSWKRRLLDGFMFVTLGIFLLLTNSRTAWILAFVSFISFICIHLYRKLKLKGIALLFGIVLLILLPLAREYSIKSSPFRASIKNYLHYRMDSFDSHFLLLKGAVQIFEKYPILGGGYGSFYEHFSKTEIASEYFGRDPAGLNTRVPAHTIWGEQLSETGILGFNIYLLLTCVSIGTLLYLASTSDVKSEVMLSSAMASVLIGWHVAGIFYSYKSEFFWLITFLYFLYGVSSLGLKYSVGNLVNYYFKQTGFIVFTLFVFAIALLFWGVGSTHLIPWDEAIYAKISKNMLESGEYLVPHWIQNKVWFEKPPLFMWLTSFAMYLLGPTSLAARLPSVVFGLGTVVTTYLFGKRLYSRNVGLFSAFVLITTTQFLYYARSSMLDVTATFFITLALYLYFIGTEIDSKKYYIFSGIAVGLGVMTKGVVGFLPLLVVFIYEIYLAVFVERITRKDVVNFIIMVTVSLTVCLPWHIFMLSKFGFAFYDSYINYHVLQRATTGIEDKGRPFLWYIVVLRVSMRIWFLWLLMAFPASILLRLPAVRDKAIQMFNIVTQRFSSDRFLILSIVTIFLFFSASESKLVWYIIPLYPLLSILIGVFIVRVLDFLSKDNVTLRVLLTYSIVVFSLCYFFLNRDFVFVGDLTHKQATLMELKDNVYGTDSTIYLDRIELPLILFYSNSPFEVVDFTPLTDRLSDADYDEDIIFITKESRYRKLLSLYPDIKMEKQIDEWVLAILPSEKSRDTKRLMEIDESTDDHNVSITTLTKQQKTVDPILYVELSQLGQEREEVMLRLNSSSED